MYSFPDWEPVCCSMSSSNFCFLTCIQISQEAGQNLWVVAKAVLRRKFIAIPQESRKTSNRQPNFKPKTTVKRRRKKKNPKISRRKET